MTALTDELDRRLQEDAPAGSFAAPSGIDDDAAIKAVELAQPLAISALADWAIDAGGDFVSYLASVRTEADPVPVDDERALTVFGKRLLPAVHAVAVEGGISEASATSILDAVSARAVDVVAESAQERGLGRVDLIDLLRVERSSLVEDGWGHWIELVNRGGYLTEPNSVSTPLNTTDHTAGGTTTAAAGHDEMPDQSAEPYGGAIVDETPEAADPSTAIVSDEGLVAPPLPVTARPHAESLAPEDEPTAESMDEREPELSAEPEQSEGSQAELDTADELHRDDERLDTTPELHRDDEDGAVPGWGEQPEGARTRVLGGALGAVGLFGVGVLVLLSTGDDTVTDTTDSNATATSEVAEADDSYDDEQVTGGGSAPDDDAATDDGSETADGDDDAATAGETDETVDLAFIDPDGGGAEAVIEAGRVVLRGTVADRAIADQLAAEYASLGVAGVAVVDELEIAESAPAPSGRVVLRDAIAFPVDSSDLSNADQGVIEVLVAVALSEANSTMTIVGHTDNTGNEADNLELSLRRANALRDLLVEAGVPTENLQVEGAGATDPIGDNATAEGRALNRRIEFELKPIAD